MDTTQNRPEAPTSAQQRNGAARTPEEQRSAQRRRASGSTQTRERPAAQPERQTTPETGKRPASRKQTPPESGKRPAPRKQAASEAEKRPRKQTAPGAEKHPAPRKQAPKDPKQGGRRQPRQGQPEETTDLSTKRRAYGNSKPKKKSAVATVMGSVAKMAQEREQARKRKEQKKRKKRPAQPTPAVIYTQPKAFNRDRLFIQLLTVTAVVVALVMGLSVFFKVQNITVTGANVYTAWTVREASGISEGDNLLTFSHARAGALIKANLPYVKTVRFGIKLPDTVNIIIEEDQVVYAIRDTNDQWWLMNSSGRVVEMTNNSRASNYTQILGVRLESPQPDERGVAAEAAQTETDPTTGELLPVTTNGAQRLSSALQIVQALEDNDLVGSAASVDVSDVEDIVVWYGTRYQVELGNDTQLAYKVGVMNNTILQLSDFDSGVLDISFTIWPDRVVYTQFS